MHKIHIILSIIKWMIINYFTRILHVIILWTGLICSKYPQLVTNYLKERESERVRGVEESDRNDGDRDENSQTENAGEMNVPIYNIIYTIVVKTFRKGSTDPTYYYYYYSWP